MQTIKTLAFLLLSLVVVTTAIAQGFRYNFEDRPYPEANVIVVEYNIVPGESNQWFLEGRVFNRGVKPAKNVRVVYAMQRAGAPMPGNPIRLTPSDVPATSFANFRERLPQVTDLRDIFLTVSAEWDN